MCRVFWFEPDSLKHHFFTHVLISSCLGSWPSYMYQVGKFTTSRGFFSPMFKITLYRLNNVCLLGHSIFQTRYDAIPILFSAKMVDHRRLTLTILAQIYNWSILNCELLSRIRYKSEYHDNNLRSMMLFDML